MKSFLKITFIAFLYFKGKIYGNYWSVLTLLVILSFSSCEDDNSTINSYPVNETFLLELTGKGIPSDIARFFAAAKMESFNPDDTTCIYLQTFPNGATREMTLRVRPNRQYTPTPDEIANTSGGTSPIYAFKYSSSIQADNTTHIDMNYYVAKEGLPTKGTELFQNTTGTVASDGAGISWGEIGKTGADVSIGTLIDYAKDNGIKLGSLGSIYALASALSSVTGALDISKQNIKWLAELDALEKCAANPTSLIARSDPNYSRDALAKINSARSELQQVNAVRFLNSMTETGAGITPVTAVLSVGLKQGFLWSEETLKNYSENTIMREARLAVVPCDGSEALAGDIDILWECTSTGLSQVDHELVHTVSKVNWVFDPTEMKYVSQGSYTFEYILTSTLGGKTCTLKKTAAGSINGMGRFMIIDDPTLQNLLGYGYIATGDIETYVTTSESCSGYSAIEPYTITWCPEITGFSSGGFFKGEVTRPSCVGGEGVTGTQKIKWTFAVAAPN